MTQWQFGLILLVACLYCLVVESKVFERCELAKVLHQRYRLDVSEAAQWVCIAQHSSGFNTAAQSGSLAGGSHGLFQISDVYWCSLPGQGAGCNLPCHNLIDDDLSDDLSCAKRIFDEHQRISGDGYTAWNAYQQYCKQNAMSYIQDCFPGKHKGFSHLSSIRGFNSVNAIEDYSLQKSGKVFERCELARELYGKHKMPMQQIPTWVCIAEHESHLNTAAVGRLNTDGSTDHGIFQISDLYWCSHDRFSDGGGKACGLPCSKLLDNDIADDVRCVQRIFSEHAALSGDGFNAWTVYKPYCQSQGYAKIENCFQKFNQQQNKLENYGLEMASNQVLFTTKFSLNKNPFFRNLPNIPDKVPHAPSSTNDIFEACPKGKVYTRCSLAQELFFKHNFPIEDISTWVCIAEHESQLNTAAIGRVNADDSYDLGLFQINDRYWCDHTDQGGKACNLPCSKLLDNDIADDVACIKTIFEEHTRLSENGFNAWTVYKPHCQAQVVEHIKTCFDEKTLSAFETYQPSSSFNVEIIQENGKIYNKCELAQELYHKHHMPMEQIPKWVCIAQHESSFNTAAIGRLNADGSADHGLFQISDLYWCSHDRKGGKSCNIPCDKLVDSDITDDVKCIRTVHEEHTRISGDGFNAWTVYKPHCLNTGLEHTKDCFTEKELKRTQTIDDSNFVIPQNSFKSKPTQVGKIYKKCELAQELYHIHRMPMEQISKWVCIAQHESSLNTAAVGRLNADGSADHGLFQISDLYWCSHDRNGGKACSLPCDRLLDSDITDDVKCIKIIYEEHTRISGDGFNAWTVYKPHCGNIKINDVKECFTESEINQALVPDVSSSLNTLEPFHKSTIKINSKGKIYKKCELAKELFIKHKIPMDQVATWVCIAQHESSFNTAAVGRLNADGSLDHGLFQISDLYWCSHAKYGGKACNISCDKLLDSDITDDIECIKVIYEEHTRISGDGFNAWTVYEPHCHGRKLEEITNCFSLNQIEEITMKQIMLKKDKRILQIQQDFGKLSHSHNPFLSGLKPSTANEVTSYDKNPFLQNIRISSGSEIHESIAISSSKTDNTDQQNYQHNPFLSEYLKQSASSQNYQQSESFNPSSSAEKQHRFETSTEGNYKNNPFLNGQFTSNTINKLATKPNAKPSGINQFKTNPFLSHIKLFRNDMLMRSSLQNKSSILVASNDKNKINKNYVNTYDFRTTTTPRPKTASSRPPKTAAATTQKFTTKMTEKPTTIKPNIQIITSTTTKPKRTITNSSLINRKPTTKPQNHRYVNATTTTRTPKTSTTRQEQSKYYHSLTTIKPSTAVLTNPISSFNFIESTTSKYQKSTKNFKATTENWRKGDNTTSTKSKIYQQKSSATKPPTTTENWRKWNKTTSSKSDVMKQKSSTTEHPTTTENSRKSNKTTASNFNATTTTLVTTTENWRKWDRTTTNKYKPTTTEPLTTTENLRKWDETRTRKTSNIQQKSSTIRPPTTTRNSIKTTTSNYNSTTAKPLTTTENWRKWDKSTTTTTKFQTATENLRNRDITRTTKLQNSTENWRRWDRTTTKSPSTTSVKAESKQQSVTRPLHQTLQDNWTKWERTTTEVDRTTSNWKTNKAYASIKPQTSTEKWGNSSQTPKKPGTTNRNLQKSGSNLKSKQNTTTSKPKTSTESWRKWDRTTSKESNATTKSPKSTTSNWQNVKELSTQKPLISTENWKKWDSKIITKPIKEESTTQKTTIMITTTSKPSQTTTNSWKSGSSAAATKLTTTKPIRFENYKHLTTKFPYNKENVKTTTQRPYFNKSSTWNSSDTSAEFEIYKKDLFSHPFFAKVNEQIELLRGSYTAKVTSAMPKKNQSLPESTLHQDLKNRTFH